MHQWPQTANAQSSELWYAGAFQWKNHSIFSLVLAIWDEMEVNWSSSLPMHSRRATPLIPTWCFHSNWRVRQSMGVKCNAIKSNHKTSPRLCGCVCVCACECIQLNCINGLIDKLSVVHRQGDKCGQAFRINRYTPAPLGIRNAMQTIQNKY